MRADLGTAPKVVRIMSALKADRLRVVGALHAIWSIFDGHTDDGKLNHYSAEILDTTIGWPGFAAAMVDVGWLKENKHGLEIPRFSDHNGSSAKRRAMDADRKKDVRKMSASEADESPQNVRPRIDKKLSLKPTRVRARETGPVDKSSASTKSAGKNWWKSEGGAKAMGEKHGVHANPGESLELYVARIWVVIHSHHSPSQGGST